jgi:ATP-dependent DNA helicase RecG
LHYVRPKRKSEKRKSLVNLLKIEEILRKGKGVDLHWFPIGVSVSELAETLVSMANTEGGIILVGISPNGGQIQNIREPEAVIDLIFQASLSVEPPLVLPIPQLETGVNKKIIWVIIPKGLPHVYNLDGRYLYREGSHIKPLSPKRLRQRLIERGTVQFESQIPPNATMEDLSPVLVSHYLTALSYSENETHEKVLRQRGCIGELDGVWRPTYAGLLLFGKQPQQWLPSTYIMASRFPGGSFSDNYVKQEIVGTLTEQIKQAEVFIRDHMRVNVHLKGLIREDIPEYPFEAVRELIVNAVAHRDYNAQGDGIHIQLFSNRLEVHSPGGLPGPVNLDNLLEARFSRNAVIVQVLSDLGFVERLGYGLKRVVAVLQKNNLPEPIFKEIGGSFRVILTNKAKKSLKADPSIKLERFKELDINDRQEVALRFLSDNLRITNSQYQELCPNVSPETLRRDFSDLVKKGVLIKIGDKKATYYIMK